MSFDNTSLLLFSSSASVCTPSVTRDTFRAIFRYTCRSTSHEQGAGAAKKRAHDRDYAASANGADSADLVLTRRMVFAHSSRAELMASHADGALLPTPRPSVSPDRRLMMLTPRSSQITKTSRSTGVLHCPECSYTTNLTETLDFHIALKHRAPRAVPESRCETPPQAGSQTLYANGGTGLQSALSQRKASEESGVGIC